MVKTQKLPMQEIAARLTTELGTDVKVAGVEAVMGKPGSPDYTWHETAPCYP